MYLGRFTASSIISFSIALHRFETGQSYAGTVEAYIYLSGSDPNEGEELTSTGIDNQTGCIMFHSSPPHYSAGKYEIMVIVTVDTVVMRQFFQLEVV